jgi:hypothetical protein
VDRGLGREILAPGDITNITRRHKMPKNLVSVIKGSIDYNRIAEEIKKAGYFPTSHWKVYHGSLKDIMKSQTMEELRVASDRFVKQANGWFLDRYLDRHYGRAYLWSPKKDEIHVDWNAGETHAKSLDGRQPNVFEMNSLIDRTKKNPAIIEAAKVLELRTDDWYWTGEEWSSASAWFVSFYGGYVYSNGKGLGCYVRPVRSQ